MTKSTLNKDLADAEFTAATGLEIKKDISASKETTFRIGGNFERFFEVNAEKSLSVALKLLSAANQRLNILGAGSNILAPSEGVPGWTLRLGRAFRAIETLGAGNFRVGGAYSFSSLARELSMAGFSGLEFAAGIPGSMGGALRMNAGAHGGETSSIISVVEGVNAQGDLFSFAVDELQFSYRSCSLPKNVVVTSVEIQLKQSDAAEVMKTLNSNLEYRKRTQPLALPSAGSVFRNPSLQADRSAGAIIDSLGLKGREIGGAAISELHANWIVNPNKTATSSDVIALIDLCVSEAQEHLLQPLQTEVVMW